MKPVDFEYSNGIPGSEIPVNRTHGMVLSKWVCCTWQERLELALFGRIWVSVQGDAMPPTLLSGNRNFIIMEDEW